MTLSKRTNMRLQSYTKNSFLLELYIRKIESEILNNYPHFKEWFKRFKYELEKGIRSFILAFENNEVIGAVLLKHCLHENKICLFHVKENYRRMGVGTTLMEQALFKLKRPVGITCNEKIEYLFFPFLSKFNFDRLSEKLSHSSDKEIYFNLNET